MERSPNNHEITSGNGAKKLIGTWAATNGKIGVEVTFSGDQTYSVTLFNGDGVDFAGITRNYSVDGDQLTLTDDIAKNGKSFQLNFRIEGDTLIIADTHGTTETYTRK